MNHGLVLGYLDWFCCNQSFYPLLYFLRLPVKCSTTWKHSFPWDLMSNTHSLPWYLELKINPQDRSKRKILPKPLINIECFTKSNCKTSKIHTISIFFWGLPPDPWISSIPPLCSLLRDRKWLRSSPYAAMLAAQDVAARCKDAGTLNQKTCFFLANTGDTWMMGCQQTCFFCWQHGLSRFLGQTYGTIFGWSGMLGELWKQKPSRSSMNASSILPGAWNRCPPYQAACHWWHQDTNTRRGSVWSTRPWQGCVLQK